LTIGAKARLEEADKSDEETEWAEKVKRRRQRMHHSWVDEEHPGCQLAGHLLLDRAPGNFHIQARSPHHDLVPHMTNVSHLVHHLSVGEPFAERLMEDNSIIPPHVRNKLKPMNGNAYITQDIHEAYHHYIKIVTTNVEGLRRGNRVFKAYQILQNSQLSYYESDIVPGKVHVRFVTDCSILRVGIQDMVRLHYVGYGHHWRNLHCCWHAGIVHCQSIGRKTTTQQTNELALTS